MDHAVLSEQALKRLKVFLAEPAYRYDPDRLEGTDPYGKILDWALDPDHGGLPRYSAAPFANWLSNGWTAWTEEAEEEGTTVEQVLQGAVEDWCGGRVMPS